MSKLTLRSLILVLVFYMNSQLPEVGARMSDDMMIPKRPLNEPETHVHLDGNPRSQGRELHLVLSNQLEKSQFNRLPGVCKRIRRRRIRVLCNVEKYCSMKHDNKYGQICPCPRGSRCGHFFLKSL